MTDKKKRYWIIGASSGIGKALAIELHRLGHELILSSRNRQKLDVLNQSLGSRHTVISVDVADHDLAKDTVDELYSTFTKIDSVIFMAGTYSPKAITDMDITETIQTIEVNLLGAMNIVQCILPNLKKQKSGQIALCSSVAAYRGLPNGQPYSASKAGLSNFAESLYLEMKPFGIDIKLISPGFVRTTLTDKNEFKMPMIIEPDQAAKSIVKGLDLNAFEIHFPKRFTYLMKLLRVLPNWIYFSLVKSK